MPGSRSQQASARIRIGETLIAANYLAVTVLILFAAPRPALHIGPLPAIICMVVMAASANFRFETPFGSTVATQVAFVPLMFVMPLGLVPIAVVIAMMASEIPAMVRGEPIGPLITRCTNASWFTIGPVAVFALADVLPRDASGKYLVLALLAQFVVNFIVSLVRSSLRGSSSVSELLRGIWVYGVDAALYGVGLVVAYATKTDPVAPFALLPLMALLAVFGRERESRISGLVELKDAYEGTARVLGNVIEADDSYTGEHSQDVLQLCREVSERLRLPTERERALEFGALLHDVGKVRVPKEIINKRGPLNDAEWKIVRTHPVEGQRLLDMVGGFMGTVGVIVRAHHERWDGRGYPDGLSGEEIPIEARIISCCDTWNAMRTTRSYRHALSFEDATREIEAVAGTQLDPAVVDALLFVVRKDNLSAPHRTAVTLAARLSQQASNAPATAAVRPEPTPRPPEIRTRRGFLPGYSHRPARNDEWAPSDRTGRGTPTQDR